MAAFLRRPSSAKTQSFNLYITLIRFTPSAFVTLYLKEVHLVLTDLPRVSGIVFLEGTRLTLKVKVTSRVWKNFNVN